MRNTLLHKTAALTLAVLMLMTLCACNQEEPAARDAAIPVTVEEAKTGDLVLKNTYIGTLAAGESVYVVPLAAGEITGVFASVGDTVEEGQLLMSIDDEAARLALASAEAAYASAKASMDQATGAPYDLADLQLDSNIRSLKDSISAYTDSLGDAKDSKSDLQDEIEGVETAGAQLAAAYQQAASAYADAVDAQKTLVASDVLSDAELRAVLSDPSHEAYEACGAVHDLLVEWGASVDRLDSYIDGLEEDMDSAAEKLAALSSAKTSMQGGLDSLDGAIKQYRQAISGYRDALQLAEDSADITQGDLREETQAILDAQLGAVSAGVKAAEYQMSLYQITAPISGVVESVSAQEHGFAGGSAAFVISDKASMTATFYVAEEVRNALTVGQAVTVERNGKTYPGEITEIGVSLDLMKGLFKIEASVKAEAGALASNTTVSVTTDTYRQQGAVLVPYDAVYYGGEGAYVFLAKDGKAVRTPIQTGLSDETVTAVTEGVSAGDRVVTSWSPDLADGAELSYEDPDGGVTVTPLGG
ncbi:MAG TPA: efflux RND transporter periplasmic adaptor subunit [Oscillospiraceae bacterium]|nr:efflux RND transporter periplasmic adaptor subunit [Oscillospiraceae bacterium]HNW05149.1 efflux RND transporter periplasmic adaptor subunit [Oscillospiraceae bacterium]